MDSAHEKLLEQFEDFEQDLEVEAILKKFKESVRSTSGVSEFGEKLKERERLKQAAQIQRETLVEEKWSPWSLPTVDDRLVHPRTGLLLWVLAVRIQATFDATTSTPPSPNASHKTCPTMLPLHLPQHQTPHDIPTKRRGR